MEKLLKIDDVCDLLQVKRSTVYEWTHAELIPHYKFPKGVRFKEAEVDSWVKRRKVRCRNSIKLDVCG